MASEENTKLSDLQMKKLAEIFSFENIVSIAFEYLNVNKEDMEAETRLDPQEFKRNVIKRWQIKIPKIKSR